MRATIPVVAALVLATFNKPFVEFKLALELVKLSKLPVVNAFAEMLSGFSVVAVDQFQICAKFKLSIVFVVLAALKPENGQIMTICFCLASGLVLFEFSFGV